MKFEFSAGGVVFRKKPSAILGKMAIEVLLGQHSQHRGWVFPKGLIGDIKKGELKEETAIREVKEETGITARILKELTPIEYWYEWQGEKRKKKVYYFLMEYVSGDTKDHDFEMANVEWVPIDKVENRLTFASDKKVWQEAKKLILGM
ncbi:MAG: hydrolase [Patescibacteria group bacterium]|nr:MAG: hydrolase [Patescibacteria group bacterium]